MHVQSLGVDIPRRQLFAQKARHTTYRSLRSVHPFFAQLTLLPDPSNPVLFNAFQSARHPQKFPFSWGMYIPMQCMFPVLNPTQHSKLHLDRFSRFCSTAHDRESLQMKIPRMVFAAWPRAEKNHRGSQQM